MSSPDNNFPSAVFSPDKRQLHQVYVITQAAATATTIAVARLGAALPNGSVIHEFMS